MDDLLIASNHLADLSLFKKDLAAQFEMEDMGEASFILGIDIRRDRTHALSASARAPTSPVC